MADKDGEKNARKIGNETTLETRHEHGVGNERSHGYTQRLSVDEVVRKHGTHRRGGDETGTRHLDQLGVHFGKVHK